MHTLQAEELRGKVVEFAKRVVGAMPACTNEESTKLFLVMPMLGVLGFDYTNPFEVHPEHAADFSGSNKVDLAILRDGAPIIAIECKKVGVDLVEERAQLRGYFNALVTTKLGILTNGVVYEFFVDSGEPNIMDEEPFLTLDLEMASRVGLQDEVLDGLLCMTRDSYDPAGIAEAAYTRLVRKRLRTLLTDEFANPSEEFCRLALRGVDVKHVRRDVIESHFAPMVRAAIRDVIGAQKTEGVIPAGEEMDVVADCADGRIVTTERELAVVAYVRRRLAFLIKDEAQFAALADIGYKDYIGKLRVYYGQVQKGRLFDFVEGADGYDKYYFPDPVGEIITDNLLDIDAALKSIFVSRFWALNGRGADARPSLGQRVSA